MEAAYHFHLYHFLQMVIGQRREVLVTPEFPTGNGKIDILVRYKGQRYALELKSFRDLFQYREALVQAAQYGQQLGLAEVTLGVFLKGGNEEFYQRLEVEYLDGATQVKVIPIVMPVMASW